MIVNILRWIAVLALAFAAGKLMTKIKMPSILGISLLAAIVDLGAPLDYHLILGAGLYTFIYIAARASGKYFGASSGAIAAAAVINEFIAVIAAKKGFELAGEIKKA